MRTKPPYASYSPNPPIKAFDFIDTYRYCLVGFDCVDHMARCSPLYVVGANLTVLKGPRNIKALAFGHQATFGGAKAIMTYY